MQPTGIIAIRLRATAIMLVMMTLNACNFKSTITVQLAQGASNDPTITAADPANPKAGDIVFLTGKRFPTRTSNLVARVILADSGTKDSTLTVTNETNASFTVLPDTASEVKTILMMHDGKTLARFDIVPAAVATIDALTFSPAAGSYGGTQSVTIASAQPNVTIYYTTDGSTPTTSSRAYSGAITVAASETITAYAVKKGFNDSALSTAAYVINGPAADPTFSLATGSYSSAQSVAITSTTTNAIIFYTTDGSTPTSSSTAYSSAISVSSTQTIKAFATKANFTDSGVGMATYTINGAVQTPVASVTTGGYSNNQSVTLASIPMAADIYYTTDGVTTPTTSSTHYTGTITISGTTTLQAIAVMSDYINSGVMTETYTMTAATPIADVAVGGYLSIQSVTLSSVTAGATIHYNTGDGTQTAPTCSNGSTSMPISVPATTTIKAVACKENFTDSSVEAFPYTINGTAADPVITVTSYTTKTVQMTSATAGASVYYTTDNSTPSASSILYTGSVSLTGAPTIKAITIKAGYSNSAVTSYDFNFDQARDYAASSVNYMRHFKTGDNLNGWHADPGTTLAAISTSPAGSPNSQALMASPGDGIYSDAGYGQGAELPNLTQDFTIEMWLYVDSFVADDGIGAPEDFGSGDPAKRAKIQIFGGDMGYPLIAVVNIDASISTCLDCANSAASYQYSSSSASVIQLQTWQHIALVGKVGTGVKTFVDGVMVNSINSLPPDNGESHVGLPGNLTMFTGHDFDSFANVYASNMRMSQIARYGTAFTPKFVNFANYGGVKTLATTSLLLHMDGSNNSTTITDSAAAAHSASVDGTAAKISTTQSKFGGSSAYFDGSSGIQIARATDLAFGGVYQDFTIEMWLYPTANHNENVFFESRAPGGNATPGFGINAANGGPTAFEDGFGFYDEMIGASNPSTAGIALNTWSHFALVRSGSSVTYYVNGVASGSEMFTFSGDALNPSAEEGYIRLGAIKDGYTNPHNYNGYMDEVRITNGQALYTSNFTPATSAFTATTTYKCYANGVLTSDLNGSGTGTCSGDGRAYINGVGQ